MRPSSVVDGDENLEEALRLLAQGGPVPRRLLRAMADWAVAEIDVLRGELEELPELQCPECDAVIRARMADGAGEHLLGEPRRLRYPGGKDGMWVVRCSCGYRTAPSASEVRALQYARTHQRARNAASPGSGSA